MPCGAKECQPFVAGEELALKLFFATFAFFVVK